MGSYKGCVTSVIPVTLERTFLLSLLSFSPREAALEGDL